MSSSDFLCAYLVFFNKNSGFFIKKILKLKKTKKTELKIFNSVLF